ncbi:MAG: cyclic nucleotide-binding domain-containing protein [Bacteroidales bacterium]|nr:cyclic nucleotide-binding domain-containing protein [Bacteroidales bacterium]
MSPENLISHFSFEKDIMDELANAEIRELSAGTIILKEQQFIKQVPLVLDGSIKLRKLDPTGREIVFYHIEPGESCILSITSCLNEKESQAEAIVEKRTRLLLVSLERPGR